MTRLRLNTGIVVRIIQTLTLLLCLMPMRGLAAGAESYYKMDFDGIAFEELQSFSLNLSGAENHSFSLTGGVYGKEGTDQAFHTVTRAGSKAAVSQWLHGFFQVDETYESGEPIHISVQMALKDINMRRTLNVVFHTDQGSLNRYPLSAFLEVGRDTDYQVLVKSGGQELDPGLIPFEAWFQADLIVYPEKKTYSLYIDQKNVVSSLPFTLREPGEITGVDKLEFGFEQQWNRTQFGATDTYLDQLSCGEYSRYPLSAAPYTCEYAKDGAAVNNPYNADAVTVNRNDSPEGRFSALACYNQDQALKTVSTGRVSMTVAGIEKGDTVKLFCFEDSQRIVPAAPAAVLIDGEAYRNTECGSAIFADSQFEEETLTKALAGFSPTLKGNGALLCPDIGRDTQYLRLDKTLPDDMHLDLTLVSASSYLALDADFKLDRPGAVVYPFILRDSTTVPGKQTDHCAVTVNAEGRLCLQDGAAVADVSDGRWFNLGLLYDLNAGTFDIYLDGRLLRDACPIPNAARLKQISLVRTWLYPGGGTGALGIDNYKVYEGRELIREFPEEWTSIFPGGAAAKTLLKGKAAFQLCRGSAWNGAELRYFGVPVLDGGEIYLPLDAVNFALSLQLTGPGDTLADSAAGLSITTTHSGYVPAAQLAQKLGKRLASYQNGLLLLTADPVSLTEKEEQTANNYLFYLRPSAGELRDAFEKQGQGHPRLLLDSGKIAQMRDWAGTDPYYARMAETIKTAAIYQLYEDVAVYELSDGYRLLPVSRDVLSKMETLGMAYLLTGEERFAERAKRELRAVCAFPDWNPAHYLDTGEMMAAVAVGYDWLYDALSAEDRRMIETALVEKGLSLTQKAYYGRLVGGGIAGPSGFFATAENNFNAVCNGGSVMAALAIADRQPELCFDVLEKAQRSLEYLMPQFAPDGGWEEGINYWTYTMSYLSKLLGSMESALGADFGLSQYPGLSQTADFAVNLDSWQGINNFHDTWAGGHTDSPALSYLALKYGNRDWLRYRHFAFQNYKKCYPTVYDLIWYDPGCAAEPVALPSENLTRGIESLSIRESFEDPEGLYFSTHGGYTHASHAHLDCGAFVFDVMGERFAIDVDPEEYNLMAGQGYDLFYRRRAEGHNTVVINPDKTGGQVLESYTACERFGSSPGSAFGIYDLTQAYERDAKSFRRGFYVGDGRRSLTVRDEIILKGESELYWFLHTRADIEITGPQTAVLTQNGKKLLLELVTNAAEATLSVMDAVPLDTSPNPAGQNPNAGIRKVAVRMKAGGFFTCTVKLSPLSEPASQTGVMTLPLSEW